MFISTKHNSRQLGPKWDTTPAFTVTINPRGVVGNSRSFTVRGHTTTEQLWTLLRATCADEHRSVLGWLRAMVKR